ncbi:metallophosphoesterase, partial [bacterium]|nr:metallophosphoesterase [candidate division CSSED10-310 bacterium]
MPGGEPVRRSLGLPRFPHFTAAAETLADVLASDTERRHRPMAPGTGQPGLIFRFADAVERILFIGDLHPTSQTQDNLQVLLEPVWNDLLSGRLGLVILGDFTHPGDGDMTDMKPSIHLFTDLLAPLKVMFPDRVALLRGDHESVGSPFGLDFGKAAGGIPARSAGDNLLEMITDGVIWMFAPQQPAHLEQDDEYAGLWDLSPTAERYCLKGNRLLAKGYEGRWYDFSHLEPGSTEIEMVFRNQDNPLDIRTLRPRLENDVIHFMVSGDCDYDGCRCTMVLNQSKLFGAAVAAVAGNDFPSFLQARVYDRLPLIATGKSFIANHAAPPWQLNDTPRPPNGIDELLELQP